MVANYALATVVAREKKPIGTVVNASCTMYNVSNILSNFSTIENIG